MTTYYIAPTTHPTTPGNDTTGNGSSATPWATISKAITASATSDTIICKAGTYTWSTQSISDRTVRGESDSQIAVFDAAGASVQWTLAGTCAFQDIVFQNMIMSNANNPAFRLSSLQITTFTRCKFLTIQVLSSGNISGGLFGSQFSPDLAAAVSVTFSTCLFNVRGVTGGTRQMFTARAANVTLASFAFLFTNCIFYFSAGGTSDITEIFSRVFTQPTLVFTVTMKNCIMENVGGATILYENANLGTSSDTLSYSCFHNISTVPSGTNNITSDPLFVDAANSNFALRPTSPCRDTGTLV